MTLPSDSNAKLWLALLYELGLAGGRAKPPDIFPKLRAYFPDITDEDLKLTVGNGESKWVNTIRWARQRLVDRRCIDRTTPGVWGLTPLGKKWLDEAWQGPDADYSTAVKPAVVAKPPPNGAKQPRQQSVPTSTKTGGGTTEVSGSPPVQTPPIKPVALADPTDDLCQRLQKNQRQSNAPQQFEQDLTEAFAALGFDAQHIGGSGETDIFLEAPLGQSSYSVVVDAKSTATGKVADAQINWPVIDTHRQGRGATFAAVVGEDFSGGQLQKFADQYKVTLVTTAIVCELLRLHARTPLSLLELRDLFAVSGRADAGIQASRERSSQHERHWRLIGEIVGSIERLQRRTQGGAAPKGITSTTTCWIARRSAAISCSQRRLLSKMSPTQSRSWPAER